MYFVEVDFPIGRRAGDFIVERARHGTHDRGVFEGERVLVTMCPPQREDAPAPRTYEGAEKIARLRFAGALTLEPNDHIHRAVLVEDEPAGHPVGWTTLPLPKALALAEELLWLVDDHGLLGGLRPELIYVDAGAQLTGIAPRGEPFCEHAERVCYGVVPPFSKRTLAPERIAMQPFDEAADVFAIGVMLAQWITGEHPFAGEYDRQILAVLANQRRRWTGPAALGRIIDSALSPAPAERPLPAELIGAIARLR